MAELTILPERPEEEPLFEQRPSRILFQALHEAKWSIDEIYDDGGYAEIERYSGFLDYTIVGLLSEDELSEGWHVMSGFTTSWHRSYEGEVDADHEYETVRPARWRDVREITNMQPWWADVLLAVGVNLRVPADWTP